MERMKLRVLGDASSLHFEVMESIVKVRKRLESVLSPEQTRSTELEWQRLPLLIFVL